MHQAMPRVRASVVALVAVVLSLVAVPAASAADSVPPVVSVDGGRLVDSSGGTARTLQLRGVNRSGTEYACSSGADPAKPGKGGYAIFDGPTYDSAGDSKGNSAQDVASVDAMQQWGINAVRIPLSDACWFGDPSLNPAYSGTNYQQAIANYVDLLARKGIVAILSLHVASTDASPNLGLRLLPMPGKVRGPDFWASVVQRMASALPAPDPGQSQQPRRNIVYDAFNEPHLEDLPTAARWDCWENGCSVNSADAPDPITGQPPVPDPTPAYDTAGMASIVARIRTAESNSGSPTRPIMLGGIDFANDLSEWATHLPTDPKNALVASFHVYGNGTTQCAAENCWNATVAPIRQGTTPRPVVTGEVGQYDCRSDFLTRYTDWADHQTTTGGTGISYLAWTWNATLKGTPAAPGVSGGWKCDGGPSVLKFNDGTPTDAYGLAYCQHLQARRADEGGPAIPQSSGPCPASRPLSSPPADATPVPPPPGPGTGTTPTTPVDPGPGTSTTPAPTTTTAPTPTVPTPVVVPPKTPTPVEPRTARVTSAALKVLRGKVTLVVSCAKGSTPCKGQVKVRTTKKVALGRRRAVLVLVSAGYDLKAGRSAKLVAKPTADGRKLLRRTRKVTAIATATSTGGLPTTKRLTLSR